MEIFNARFGGWALLISLLGLPFATMAQPSAIIPLGEALEAPSLVWISNGAVSWSGQDIVSHDGIDAAQSGPIGHAMSSSLQTTITGPGTLSFWWKVSSATNVDRLYLLLDGTAYTSISGEVAWQQRAVMVPAGVHDWRWVYSKNALNSGGQDRGWVDEVQFISSTNGCSFVLSPGGAHYSAGAPGSTGSVSVTTAAGCDWTALSSSSWIGVLSSPSNSGSGTVVYFAAANTNSSARGGFIRIADQTFVVTQDGFPCNYTLAPTNRNHDSEASTNSVTVSTPSQGCTWTVFSTNTWISILSSNIGSGNGTVIYSVATNASPVSRNGALVIGGRLFPITQSGFDCSYSLSATSGSYGADPVNDAVNVTTSSELCPWSVWTTNAWITIFSDVTRTGSVSVAYALAANPSPQPSRSGYIFIAGQILAITQSGSDPAILSHPVSRHVLPGAATTFSVAAAGTPPFTYQWQFNRAPLTDGDGISGASTTTLMLANVQVSQSGSYRVLVSNPVGVATSSEATLTVTCGFTLFPRSANYSSLSATGSIVVSAFTNCPWNIVNTNSWVTILSAVTNSGNGTVAYVVARNSATNTRSGTIRVADQDFAISQIGGTPTNATVSLAEALDTVGVLPWGTVQSPPWFGQELISHDGEDAAQSGAIGHDRATTVTTTVNGPGTISFWWKVSSEANSDYLKFFINGAQQLRISGEVDWQLRSLPLSEGTKILKWTYSKNGNGSAGLDKGWLDQVRFLPGTGCVVTLSQTSATHSPNSETGQVSVTTTAGCTWAVNNSNTWITPLVDVGGGNGYFRYTVAANNSSVARTGIITIGNQTFTVVQSGVCAYSLSPASRTHTSAAANGTVAVTTQLGCAWNVFNTNDWVTILSSMNNSGSGQVGYSVAANTTEFTRSGYISIDGQLFAISQAGNPIPIAEAIDVIGTSLYVWHPGDLGWVGQSNTTHDGVDAFQSIAGGTGGFTLVANGPGTLSFWWKVSSPTNSSLRFYVNGSELARIEREADWRQQTIILPIGIQNLEWHYVNSLGSSDRGWVDQVQWVPSGACPVTFSQASASFSANAATGVINVSTPPGCARRIIGSTNSWITIASGGNGTGSGTVAYNVSTNPTATTRSGYINISGEGFLITQAGSSNGIPPCSYYISATNISHSSEAAAGVVTVLTQPGCEWSVFNTNSWITIFAYPTNSGSGHVTYSVSQNTALIARSGQVRIDGQIFTVSQSAAPAPPPGPTLAEALDTDGTSLEWFYGSSVGFTENWKGQSAVTHDGADAVQSGDVIPNGFSPFGALSYFGTTAWVPGTLTFWWKVSSGSSNGGLHFFIDQVEQAAILNEVDWQQRTFIIPAGLHHLEWNYWDTTAGGGHGHGWVDQVQFIPTPGCAVALSSSSTSFIGTRNSTGYFDVVTAGNCAWSAINTNPWISIVSGGNGTGSGSSNYTVATTLTYTVAANPTASTRSGYIRILDQTYFINQSRSNTNPPGNTNAPTNCIVSISPGSRAHGSASATGTVAVTTQTNCAWSVGTTNSWISILSSLSNSSSGTVIYSLAPNTNLQARIGGIHIGGQQFLLTQAGTSQSGTNAARLQFMSRSETSATLSVQGEAGKMYVVECSEDLFHWIPISTNSAPSTVTDAAAGNAPWRFYRTVEVP